MPGIPTCYTIEVEKIQHLLPNDIEEKTRALFESFDKDKDGFFNHSENHFALNEAFSSFGRSQELGEFDTKELFGWGDINQDGLLSYEEFKRLYIGLYLHTLKQNEMQEMGLPYCSH